jgi:sec-independent protein translocase protein TatA
MLPHFGVPELVIIMVIILLLFGVGRISKIAGELGSGLRSFKDGLQGPEGEKDKEKESEKEKAEI